jgi:hypothetical protein
VVKVSALRDRVHVARCVATGARLADRAEPEWSEQVYRQIHDYQIRAVGQPALAIVLCAVQHRSQVPFPQVPIIGALALSASFPRSRRSNDCSVDFLAARQSLVSVSRQLRISWKTTRAQVWLLWQVRTL